MGTTVGAYGMSASTKAHQVRLRSIVDAALLFLALSLLAVGFAAGPRVASDSDPPTPATVAAVIRNEVSALDGLGVSVAVGHGAHLEWASGFGSVDLATKQPASAETVFQVGRTQRPSPPPS